MGANAHRPMLIAVPAALSVCLLSPLLLTLRAHLLLLIPVGLLLLIPALRRLKAEGTSFVFISHFLEDVLQVSDRVTVFRNSRRIETADAAAVDAPETVAAFDEVQMAPPSRPVSALMSAEEFM